MYSLLGNHFSGGMGAVKTKRLLYAIFITILIGSISGCTNLQAIQDFGLGTSDFGTSYDSLYSGSYDTCLTSAEIRNVIIELGETPSRSPLTQLQDDKGRCAPYKPTTEAFNESSLALADYGKALQLVAKQNQSPSFKNVQIISQFNGIDENIVNIVPELSDSQKDVETVNQWKVYFPTFYAHKTPREVILETDRQVQATLNLLTIFTEIYQTQLDDYERNINVLDTLIYDTGSSDAIKRTFVINKSRDKNARQELLKNYNEALSAVKESQKKLYQRSELESPHYGDPIFQQEMREFLINVSTLIQQSKLISQ